MKNTGLEDEPDDLNLGNPRQAVPGQAASAIRRQDVLDREK